MAPPFVLAETIDKSRLANALSVIGDVPGSVNGAGEIKPPASGARPGIGEE